MNSLLINGAYDLSTFEILKAQNVKEFSFDLRGRSSNLITFKELKIVLSKIESEKVFLTFENDKKEIILSFLNLIGPKSNQFILIFRDSLDASFYRDLKLPFFWMFNPDGQWKEILSLDHCRGVLLPIRLQNQYQKPELWNLFEEKHLDVYLHAETFEQTAFMKLGNEIKLSLDLSAEIEKSYRTVDQEKLKSMKIWRAFHENSVGQ